MTGQPESEPKVGVEEARATFGAILRRAGQDGQSTIITHRGFPVARVVPCTSQPGPTHADLQGLLDACNRVGWVENEVAPLVQDFFERHGFDLEDTP